MIKEETDSLDTYYKYKQHYNNNQLFVFELENLSKILKY